MCAFRIRQFARKIKVECLLTYHALIFDESKAPSEADLKKVDVSEISLGKFNGWGYYYSISNEVFRKSNPLYFKIDK